MTKHDKWLKKLGLKEIEINMGMFDFDIIVVIGKRDNLNEYLQFKFEDKYFNLGDYDDGFKKFGQCFGCPSYSPIIWIPNLPKTPRQHGTLAHECFHATMHLIRWTGIKVSRDSEEVVAHAVSYLVTSILKTRSKV